MIGILVIGGLILAPAIAIFIRQAREQDRAYGPLTPDDFASSSLAWTRNPGPSCSSSLPGVEQGGRETVAPQGHSAQGAEKTTAHALTDTERVRHGLKAHCSCGATYQPLAALADCGAWVRTHAETELMLEAFAPRGAS